MRFNPLTRRWAVESGLLGEEPGLVGLQTGHVTVQMVFEHLQGDHCRDVLTVPTAGAVVGGNLDVHVDVSSR
eukprot:COSAG03_NODE_4265_length_1615_cov_94.953826_1_plen_72_part_00